ncbi:MAG: thiamine-phosphate kinase [Bacteroidia bacterium]|nr:thiamine-phosphate kinase [Bacteroidia bacterium]MDW8134087.1 thiamine-phosphate kinase [Bacteroidia bacterium]
MEKSLVTEVELIGRLSERLLGKHPLLVQGIGDDAAVWRWEEGVYGLVSADTLHEHWDFDRSYHALRYIGYKAAVSAISDICAMNGQPLFLVVSLGVPRGTSASQLQELYDGIREVEEKYRVAVAGGDISPSRDLWLSITVIGRVEVEWIVYRKGAAPYQIVCVTGDLGAPYAGLKVLQREKAVLTHDPTAQPDVKDFGYVIRRQLKPEARCDVVRRLKEIGIRPTSMIDLSDGLAAGLHSLAQASGVGFHIYLERLPFHSQTARVAELFQIPLTAVLLYGGEEYELLFTVPAEAHETLRNEPFVHMIGYVKEGKDVVIEDGIGQVWPIEQIGWDSLLGERKKEST